MKIENISIVHFDKPSNKLFFDARELQENIGQSKDKFGNPIIVIPFGETGETVCASVGDYLVKISDNQILPCRPELFSFLLNHK